MTIDVCWKCFVPRPADRVQCEHCSVGPIPEDAPDTVAVASGPIARQRRRPWWAVGAAIAASVLVGLGGAVALGRAGVAIRRATTEPARAVPYMQSPAAVQNEAQLLHTAQQKYRSTPQAPQLKLAKARYDDYLENNHIHAAYGIWDCTRPAGHEWLPPINGENDPDKDGIHTHADGLVHAHPFTRSAAGNGATLGRLFNATGLQVTRSAIVIPAKEAASSNPEVIVTRGGKLLAGTQCADGQPGEVVTFVFAKVLNADGALNPTAKGTRADLSARALHIDKNAGYVFALIQPGKTPGPPPSARELVAPADQIPKS
jgi:hypothetical protein